MDSDLRNLVSVEDVKKYESSTVAREAIKLLSATSGGAYTASVQEYVVIRDYLLSRIMLANANRPCLLANMLVIDIMNARKVDDCMVVSVAKHKTAWTQGPAKIVLTESVYSWLRLFVTKILPKTCNRSRSRHVFVTFNGEDMKSAQITRALQAMWKKANINDKITCTLVRKTAVSTVHREAPAMISNLADLMCHRTQTAAKCYRMVNREKTCVAAAKTLSDLTGINTNEEHLSCNEQTEDCAAPRAVWSDEQVKVLYRYFSNEINTGEISLQCVKHKKCTLLGKYMERQVYDKLCSEIQKRTEQHHASLPKHIESLDDRVQRLVGNACLSKPEEDNSMHREAAESEPDESDIIPPSVVNRTGLCKVFDPMEAAVLVENCHGIIKSGPISQDRIKEALNVSESGTKILEKFHMAQITNRLKYERKKCC